MARMSLRRLLCALLATSMVSTCYAAAAAEPAIDVKPAVKNSVAEPENNRDSHAMKSEDNYANYLRAPAPAPIPAPAVLPLAPAAVSAPATAYSLPIPANHPQPIPHPIYSNPHETTMGYVYYYLPTVQKYYPKLRDLMPFFRRNYEGIAARAWPAVRQMADRTFDISSAVGLVLLAPVLLVSSLLFLGFIIILFLFPAVSAFGKRRIGRDLSGLDDPNEVFDFDPFLPADQSRAFATLAARVDNMLDTYRSAFTSDSCLERLSCQAGQMTSRLGKYTEPIIGFLEPVVPKYVSKKFEAFRNGARSGTADCSEFKCKVPLFG